MYYPYFRGKQFELITIREMAELLAKKNFIPIIEPVRESLTGLKKTLDTVCKAGGRAIVIVNPYHGDHQEDGISITDLLREDFKDSNNISAGILLHTDMTVDAVMTHYDQHSNHSPVLIHAGFNKPRDLAVKLKQRESNSITNIFIENYANTLYRKHFAESTRILIRDGFKRRKNSEFAKVSDEEFSELHLTFQNDLGMDGFGDFLTVGDAYFDSGGPAYAVAIHLTFINPDADGVMYIYHFVSTTNDTPIDPAGKFSQALSKLINKLEIGSSHLRETSAIKEFRNLHTERHFPGLGYVKKLSMKHHIETLAAYLD